MFEWSSFRNPLAFWIYGLCNSYVFSIMLSAAEDIMDQQNHKVKANSTDVCYEKITESHCSRKSTGAVLLADIIPCIFVQLIFLFFMQNIAYGVRHALIIFCQISSFIIVAFSPNIAISLIGMLAFGDGVVFASLGAGIGAVNCLALSSHFPKSTVVMWSSGSGAAGIISSFSYAALTEPHFAHLTPKATLLVMLIIPILYGTTYWFIMKVPDTVYQVNIFDPRSYIIQKNNPLTSSADPIIPLSASDAVNPLVDYEIQDLTNRIEQKKLTVKEKLKLFWPLKKYMLPLSLVYIGEYLINQGLTELIYFDCSHGFELSKHSQYRWFQVLYQLGAFFSRSSVQFFRLPQLVLYLLPVLQIGNAIFLAFDAVYFFVPHIGIIFAIIVFEGMFGGAAYGNTFHRIHKEVAPDIREFSMSATTLADSSGIVIAALSAIPLHNFICNQQNIRIKP